MVHDQQDLCMYPLLVSSSVQQVKNEPEANSRAISPLQRPGCPSPPTLLGGTPRPVHTLPTLGLDEVTYGYVPKSMSSMVALAPSTRMRLPESKAVLVRAIVSAVMLTIFVSFCFVSVQ